MTESQPGALRDTPSPRRPILVVFTSHWLAMLGLGLVLTAIVFWAVLLPAQLRQGRDNPYVGVATMAVAAVLVLGLVLTPLGLLLGRRRLEQQLAATLVEGRTSWRRLFLFLGATSLINLLISSQVTLRVVHGMETTQFCGSCHVMTPESRAFDQGPHAGILCVDCHVGEGTQGYLKSKLQGMHQLYLVLTDQVPVPIETAIASGKMVPSEETCEGCHWKDQPANATLRLIQHYGEDEANTPETTVLTMNVGGSRMGGIHGAHHGEGIEIWFAHTDRLRQDIPLVEYRNSVTGESRSYLREGVVSAEVEHLPRVKMQCFDCHNRPAHAFQMPDRAVDQALMLGRMSASLPFLKKKGVEILEAKYASSAAAAAEIPAALEAYYRSEHAEVARDRAAQIAEAGQVLADIYSRNVFPELGVTWGTYPDNRGHQDAPGCLRCHAGEHVTTSGETITQDCFHCHFPAAVSETDPKVLGVLGVDRLLDGLKQE